MTVFALPRGYNAALAAASVLVPATERENWQRLWRAELWHAEHDRSTQRLSRPRRILRSIDLVAGLVSDAVWLRVEALRVRFAGSPVLTVGVLVAFCFVAATLAFRQSGLTTHQLFFTEVLNQLQSVLPFSIVIAVAAHLGVRRIHDTGPGVQLPRSLKTLRHLMLRTSFYGTKLFLVSLCAFLCGMALFISAHHPRLFIFPQLYLTSIFMAIGLRWASRDQKQRCHQCMHSLTTPSRVGRPSHNFLEWNGTEQTCRHGHGSLHQPELETSWFDGGKWVIS